MPRFIRGIADAVGHPTGVLACRRGSDGTMSDKKINVAIVGLGFGAEFIPIYQRHPNASMYAICQRTKEKLDHVGNQYNVAKPFHELRGVAEGPGS